MSAQAEPQLLDMEEVVIDPACALKVPAPLALRRQVLPFASLDGHVYVACLDDGDTTALEAVERAVKMPVHPQRADPESLRRALNRIFGSTKGVCCICRDQSKGNRASPGIRSTDAFPVCGSQSQHIGVTGPLGGEESKVSSSASQPRPVGGRGKEGWDIRERIRAQVGGIALIVYDC